MSSSPNHYSIAPDDYHPNLITKPTAEEFAVMQQARLAEEEIRQEAMKKGLDAYNRRKWKSRMRKVMAATALLATVKSGGFADMAADPFNEAGDTARSAISVETVTIPDEMDGIKFSDYNKYVQREYKQEQAQRVENESIAENAVVSLFERIDSDGTNWLVAEVEAEKAAHPELYVSSEVADAARESISESENNEQAVAALDTFMNEYGISAGFEYEPFEDMQTQTKEALTAYVNVFSVLPKDFIAKTKLERVAVSNETVPHIDETTGEHEGTRRGSYSPDDHDIVIHPDNGVEAVAGKAAELASPADMSYELTVAHELGHAIDYEMSVGATLPSAKQGIDSDISEVTEHTLRSVAGRTEVPSMYSTEDSVEYTAELLAGLLTKSNTGLALPDEVRRFTSTSNKSMIDMLAQLEVVRPGIAKILIANRV